jgi:hypothetical protein
LHLKANGFSLSCAQTEICGKKIEESSRWGRESNQVGGEEVTVFGGTCEHDQGRCAGFLLPNCHRRKRSFRNSWIGHALLKKAGESGLNAVRYGYPEHDHEGSPRKATRIHESVAETGQALGRNSSSERDTRCLVCEVYIERGGQPDRSSLRTHPSLVFERDCARSTILCLWVHYLRSGAEANGSFCKQTECPLGKRHHLRSLGAAHLLRLLKNS